MKTPDDSTVDARAALMDTEQAPAPAPRALPYDKTITALEPALVKHPKLLQPRPAPDASAKNLLPSSLAERFEQVHFLGKGGMGTVFRAWDTQLTRQVAIKLVHGADTERVLREARAQAQIHHEHVCKIYDVGFADGQSYITMQLIEGGTLSEMAREMSLEEKVKLIRQAALALHEAHRMGFVHRDIKPANIMVERLEDGQFRPYVMDFGLARIAGAQGETNTGQLAGTPAFMAPEQARGEIRVLDRRTDVYSLGATFYDILAGHPPFESENAWKLISRIINEDAPPLRGICPQLPIDLETIIMKCLEREPSRRYESARALGEDLQRYLDGEPVLARKASLGYRLVKKARKHKLLVSLVGVALVAGIMLLGLWIRAQHIAEEEARLAQELGESVKEMQLFMRYAHALPVHDIERERSVVRKRLLDIEARTSTAGVLPRSVGHYAIGQGYLALEDYPQALSHFKEAERLGYSSPELSYALGRTLAELYRQELESLRRMPDLNKRAERQAELDALYKHPSIAYLKTAEGVRLEHPAYVEGLIALMENRHEDALRLAKQVETEAPWLYEAALLEADTRFAMGSEFRHDANFDYDKMMLHFQPAIEAYRRAAAVGSSDPAVLGRAAWLYGQMVYSESMSGHGSKTHFEEGKELSAQAIAVSPQDASLHGNQIFLYQAFYHPMKLTIDIGPGLRETRVLAEEAQRRFPQSAWVYYTAGLTAHNYANYLLYRKLDVSEAVSSAIAAYQRANELDPTFLWPVQDIVSMYHLRAQSKQFRGEDPFPDLEQAHAYLLQAQAMAPEAALVQQRVLGDLYRRTDALLWSGQDPTQALTTADKICEKLLVKHENALVFRLSCAWMDLCHAEYAIAVEDDPEPWLKQAKMLLGEWSKPSGEAPNYSSYVRFHVVMAQAAYARAQSPISDARRALEILGSATLEGRMAMASPALLLVQGSVMEGHATPSLFQEAFDIVKPILESKPINPDPYQIAAAIQERHAAWLLQQHKDPSQALTTGFALLEQAFKINPRMPPAFATQGALQLVEAKAAKKAKAKQEMARRAKESFELALNYNRFLARETKPMREEVDRILRETAAELDSPAHAP